MADPHRIDLVVTDLDGTLWDLPETVHPRTLAAVAELERRGVPLLVATGRRVASTRDALAELGLAPPAVVLNGAVALDLATDERFHRHAFHADDAARVLEVFLAAGVEPCVYVEHHEVDVFVSGAPSTHPGHLASFGHWVRTGDLAAVAAEHPVLAFGVLGLPWDVLGPLAEVVAEVASPHLSQERRYGGATITVAPPELSKWVGVEAYCARAGLDPSRVLALGDGPNDLELLDGAAVALVPEDGHAEALARADHVIGEAVDGGWAEVLDLLC
jgi:hydroxymethylpyrimidine pyrophosphatase-like HAD family hydrolase